MDKEKIWLSLEDLRDQINNIETEFPTEEATKANLQRLQNFRTELNNMQETDWECIHFQERLYGCLEHKESLLKKVLNNYQKYGTPKHSATIWGQGISMSFIVISALAYLTIYPYETAVGVMVLPCSASLLLMFLLCGGILYLTFRDYKNNETYRLK